MARESNALLPSTITFLFPPLASCIMTTLSYLDKLSADIWRPVLRHVVADFDKVAPPAGDLAAFVACLTVCRRWKVRIVRALRAASC
jgi:hypothetical protein